MMIHVPNMMMMMIKHKKKKKKDTTFYPLSISELTTLRYIFTKRPFILRRAFLEIGKTTHEPTNEVVLIRRCRRTDVILLQKPNKQELMISFFSSSISN